VPAASATYRPRQPERDALRQVVREHFETFRTRVAATGDGGGLPSFVERAFRAFLTCGALSGGFARFRCAGCGLDRLVAFSCKGRGLCPSCGGRRMAERAAHLVDHVLPDVPVRHWVLSLPYHLRYLLAWDHDLCRAVAARLARAVFRLVRERARDEGVEGGRGGAVVVIQRFGGALNLNVHFHALVLDGVFAPADDGTPVFHRTRRLTTLDVREVLATVEPLVARHRLQVTGDGQVRLSLRHPWRDGTTVLVFDPVAFLGRLAVLVPRPRVNLVLSYGVLGARAAWRRDVVAGARRTAADADGPAGHDDDTTADTEPEVADGADRGLRWAAVMARTFGLDVLACPRCGGRLRLVALIDQAAVIGRILRHLGLPVEVPSPRPARAPPLVLDRPTSADWEGDPSVFAPCS
jgi:hypothetical protein